MEISLSKLPFGKSAIVKKIKNDDFTKRRLLDLGLIEGTEIKSVQISPFGEPVAYLIRGAVIAIRKEITDLILVCPISEVNI